MSSIPKPRLRLQNTRPILLDKPLYERDLIDTGKSGLYERTAKKGRKKSKEKRKSKKSTKVLLTRKCGSHDTPVALVIVLPL